MVSNKRARARLQNEGVHFNQERNASLSLQRALACAPQQAPAPSVQGAWEPQRHARGHAWQGTGPRARLLQLQRRLPSEGPSPQHQPGPPGGRTGGLSQGTGSAVRTTRLLHAPAVCAWARAWASLGLCFLTQEVGILTEPTTPGCSETPSDLVRSSRISSAFLPGHPC